MILREVMDVDERDYISLVMYWELLDKQFDK